MFVEMPKWRKQRVDQSVIIFVVAASQKNARDFSPEVKAYPIFFFPESDPKKVVYHFNLYHIALNVCFFKF